MPNDDLYKSSEVNDFREAMHRHLFRNPKRLRSPLVPRGLPPVPTPPPFRGEPFVTGDTKFARLVKGIEDIAPEIRGRVDDVFQGMGPIYRDHLLPHVSKEKPLWDVIYNPRHSAKSQYRGLAKGKSVEVDDFRDGEPETVAHEIHHAMQTGLARRGEGAAREAGMLFNRIPKETLEQLIRGGVSDYR